MRREFLIDQANNIAEMHDFGRKYVQAIDHTIATYNDLILTVQAEITILEKLKNTVATIATDENSLSEKIKNKLIAQQQGGSETQLQSELESEIDANLNNELSGNNS